MCGITGFCDFNKKSNKLILQNMTDELSHRGPDDVGYELLVNDFTQIGIGQRRLSILDLSKKGHQPMSFEHLTITYNGEIYNFKEIRSELEKYDYVFESQSDTEVILKAFHKWGVYFIHKCIGMYAFALYDQENNKLYLYRDRAGIKPLYYYWDGNIFLFASELKSFHRHPAFNKEINTESLSLYLKYGYIPSPFCIFNHTKKLKQGHFLILSVKSKRMEEKKYWDVSDFYNKPVMDISEQEALLETEKILISSFKYRMVSDVPVGVFLSGGYDSSAVTAILQSNMTEKLKTFTIGFYEEDYNEAHYAKEVAEYLGTDHTEYYCTQKDALEIIPKIPDIFDEPFGDSSAIPTCLISKLARKKVKVALSADAGDETFAGYNNYHYILKYFLHLKNMPFIVRKSLKHIFKKIAPIVTHYFKRAYNFKTRYEKVSEMIGSHSSVEMLKIISSIFTEKELIRILEHSYYKEKDLFNFDIINKVDVLRELLAFDYKMYMADDILVKVDRATMAVGLEGRDPLLDHRIIEFAARLPSNMKYKNGNGKMILKKVVHKYLPQKMMVRPKMGFSVPIYEWFREELKDYFLTYLSKRRLTKEKLFNSKPIIELRDSYLAGNKENVKKLWFLLMFEMWYERWMN
jgi:asparagine synthase (glutamine-hydrolysing)